MTETVTRKHATFAGAALWVLFFLACEDSKGEAQVVEVAAAEAEGARPTDVSPKDAPPSEMPQWGNRLSPDGGFPCDVDFVLALSCRRCHFDPPENDAPFSLVKYENIEAMRSGKSIRQLMEQMVAADLMPPLDEPVEPKVTPLTPNQKQTLLGWLKAGAPKNPNPCP